MRRLRKRIFYLKKEFRDKTANFLVRRYTIVMLPKLETGEMTISLGRQLTTKVARKMLSLSHSDLFKRIQEKCWEYDTVFMQVREEYTSKTCVQCGKLNNCDEVHSCKSCGYVCDRDLNGAAGIFLKAVRVAPPQ